jgi:hypothetical protein
MTKFEEIYELATMIMEDEKIKQAPLYKKYLILYKFLQLSIGHFNARCFKDLKTIQPYVYKEFNFTGDGMETEYILSESAFTVDTQIYIEVETEKGSGVFAELPETDYSFKYNSAEVTFNKAINNGFSCHIVVYRIGYFFDDLDIEEKIILARGMVVPFIESQLQKESVMNHMVYGTGAKMYSQAEHLKQLNTILKDTKYEVEGIINAYTYESSPELELNKRNTQTEKTKTYENTLGDWG